ncbi:hypothetical protein LCGC14_1896100 [marine sediment metagenome]|uniref:Uncharacterized protein n=1 Tax=marine sediment metagenome TaxID=412755 RepID=A0A0F9FYA8_9ZZZZ
MEEINLNRVEAERADEIIDYAIEQIDLGLDEFSCCALTQPGENYDEGWVIRRLYTTTFNDNPLDGQTDNYGHGFANEINQYSPCREERVELRILLLSLFKAAWRDLV